MRFVAFFFCTDVEAFEGTFFMEQLKVLKELYLKKYIVHKEQETFDLNKLIMRNYLFGSNKCHLL